jgi:predicted ribosomally synthesized peptide with nif11-like leader
MSVANVKKFMKKTQSDKALDAKLKAIPLRAGQKTISEIIKVADKAGFKFTAQDYEDAVNELLDEKHAAGVLSDEELALVAGGVMCESSDKTKTCTCCKSGLTLKKSL